MGILWFSALASAIVDNIPYTATAIPIVERLIEGGLDGGRRSGGRSRLGACLGGNLTIVGASANIVVANLAARDGHPITFMQFFRYGLGVVVASLADLDRLPLAPLPGVMAMRDDGEPISRGQLDRRAADGQGRSATRCSWRRSSAASFWSTGSWRSF